ncbi:MAG: hypothetical protein HYU54_03650 [Actinobacteria bacterium]|nr:hypothetical protein [Actinomycetota bacterium]
MDLGATSGESGTKGREDRDETRLGVEIGMLPYVVGREVTAILEAAQVAADQITARAREEAESAAEQLTASARERARAVQERIARFERELAELMADGGESTESADEAAPVFTSHPGPSPAPQPESGTERIVVEYRSEAEPGVAMTSSRSPMTWWEAPRWKWTTKRGPRWKWTTKRRPRWRGTTKRLPRWKRTRRSRPRFGS